MKAVVSALAGTCFAFVLIFGLDKATAHPSQQLLYVAVRAAISKVIGRITIAYDHVQKSLTLPVNLVQATICSWGVRVHD